LHGSVPLYANSDSDCTCLKRVQVEGSTGTNPEETPTLAPNPDPTKPATVQCSVFGPDLRSRMRLDRIIRMAVRIQAQHTVLQ
jgi:hypothetical protein